jgi:MFS family permease
MPSRFGRRSDVYRVVAARFLSRAGSEAAFFVGIWGKAAYQLHASPGQLALVMFVMSVASILGTISAGVLVDRYGPRRVLAIFEVLFVPAALAMAFAHSVPALTALVGVWAFTGAPVVTAGASFAPFLVHDESALPRVNALIEGAGSASMLAGPAIGAMLAHYASVDWVFLLDAATSLVAALLVWRARLRPIERRTPRSATP